MPLVVIESAATLYYFNPCDATRLCAARGQFSVPEARPPPRARTTYRTTLSHLVHLLTAAPPSLASRTCTR